MLNILKQVLKPWFFLKNECCYKKPSVKNQNMDGNYEYLTVHSSEFIKKKWKFTRCQDNLKSTQNSIKNLS